MTLTGDVTRRLERFSGGARIIYALDSSGPDVAAHTAFTLDIPGASGAGSIQREKIPGALEMPARAAMIAPDSSAGAVTIYDEVTVEWEPIDDGDLVTIVLDVGEPILRCAVPDNGSFTISAALIAQFPAGGGSLTLARSRVRSNALLGGFLIGTGVSAQSVIVAIP